MRLLYITSDGKLKCTKDIVRNEDIPAYAILSHTWGEQEVVFDDLKDPVSLDDIVTREKDGWKKIHFCAEQAKRDRLDYFWIDTCCIDKANSTELSEAINSMFRWYQSSSKCYAFLSDVRGKTSETSGNVTSTWKAAFRESRWFKRGWTLQELLAPDSVEFFSNDRALLGNKQSLKQTIHEITKIPIDALSASDFSEFGVSERFSWAQNRQTTREEDEAYCLLGIFGCHLPLIYGEGRESALKRLRKETLEVSEDIASASVSNTNIRDQIQEERLSKILRWLSAPNPSTNYYNAREQRHASTGLWLLDSTKLKRWMDGAASRLWLYGILGCGKTILSSTIIEHLQQHYENDNRKVTVYFYFDFNDVQKQDAERMFRSLLCQLLQRLVMMPESVDELFSSSGNGYRQPSVHELLKVTPQVMRLFTHVYVVLDALDECKQRRELMTILASMAGWQLDNVHLLMTSRNERDIEISLRRYINEDDFVCLQEDLVDKDISRYVQHRLRDDERLEKWNKDPSIKQEIETALMRRARGMFRWAVCQLDALAECRNLATLRESLATLPQTLDQTYERILTSISEKDSVFAIRILQWLTFSARPISLEEVAEVVAIDVAREPAFVRDEVLVDPLEVLDICSTLVTITTDKAMGRSKLGSRIITLAHYSVQEYLVSDRIKRGPAKLYSMEETESHAVIMKGSLGYLNQFQYPIPREILRISMLSRYSAQFWISHLRKTGDKMEGLSRIAMSLFSIESPAYLIWIRLCDPDNPSQEPQFRSGLKSIPKPLYYAALLGLSTVTELLLGGGVEVNAKGGFFGSALQAASACGYKDVVQLLLDAGAEVNAQGGSCGNALRAALANEHETTVRLLINKGASVGPDAMLKGIMHHALNNPRCALSLATVLVEHGAPLDTIDVDNMTPLHYCVKFGHIAIAKQLIHAGTPVDCRARRQSRASEDDILNTGRADSMSPILRSVTIGLTPLHFAALTGNATMTHFLLEHGADPNAQSEYGETPLHLTLRTRLSGTIYQDDWNNQNRAIDFFDSKTEAIKNGDSRVSLNRRQVLDALLADPRISVTATDYRGECPLHCIQYGEPGCATLVQKLVSKGADPCCGNLRQESPLHLAIRADDHAAVVTLLSMGAKVALTDERGLNALHYAAQTGNHETMVAILGTDEAKTAELIVSKDKIGQTVLHHYLSVRPSGIQVATLRWLLDEGADSLELDNNGVSPLAKFIKIPAWVIDDDVCMLLLAIRGNESFVDHDGQGLGHLCAATPVFGVYILQMLKVYNVDLSTKDSDGRTVLHRATICGRLTEESLNFLVNVVGIQASEKDAHGCTALQYAAAAAGKDYRDIGWSNSRWERIRDVLVEYHANHPD